MQQVHEYQQPIENELYGMWPSSYSNTRPSRWMLSL